MRICTGAVSLTSSAKDEKSRVKNVSVAEVKIKVCRRCFCRAAAFLRSRSHDLFCVNKFEIHDRKDFSKPRVISVRGAEAKIVWRSDECEGEK